MVFFGFKGAPESDYLGPCKPNAAQIGPFSDQILRAIARELFGNTSRERVPCRLLSSWGATTIAFLIHDHPADHFHDEPGFVMSSVAHYDLIRHVGPRAH